MTVTAAELRPRRKPQERSVRTRDRLLDAAIACLRERGYANATVAEIALRAGVSRGAQIHHFPAKADLVTAAVAHYYERRGRRVVARFRETVGAADPIGAAVDAVWETALAPEEAIGPELEVAARTDPELREKLARYARAQPKFVAGIAREVLGDFAAHPAFDEIVQLVLHAVGGAAMARFVLEEPAREARLLETLKHMVRTALASPPTGREP